MAPGKFHSATRSYSYFRLWKRCGCDMYPSCASYQLRTWTYIKERLPKPSRSLRTLSPNPGGKAASCKPSLEHFPVLATGQERFGEAIANRQIQSSCDTSRWPICSLQFNRITFFSLVLPLHNIQNTLCRNISPNRLEFCVVGRRCMMSLCLNKQRTWLSFG